MDEIPWQKNAANLMKAELARAGVGYEELVERLKAVGVEETYKSVSSKINRGSFSFVFFMQCMKALGLESVRMGP